MNFAEVLLDAERCDSGQRAFERAGQRVGLIPLVPGGTATGPLLARKRFGEGNESERMADRHRHDSFTNTAADSPLQRETTISSSSSEPRGSGTITCRR